MADAYTPERRTALVLSGSGVDGAYHAGVLRALHESGIKIDLVAGRGIGVLGAVLFAVDGAAVLWDQRSPWAAARSASLYQLRWPFRVVGKAAQLALGVLLLPVAVAAVLSVIYLLLLALGSTGAPVSSTWADAGLAWVASWLSPGRLPTYVPRALLLVVMTAGGALLAGALREPRPARRQPGRLGSLWALVGQPLDAALTRQTLVESVWALLRGGSTVSRPDEHDLSRRYLDVLGDSLGQPGVRELLVAVHDLDVRRDHVFGLLAPPYQQMLFGSALAADSRRAEAHDAAGDARDQLMTVLGAALSLPALCPPVPVPFGPATYWQGETHRMTDRPGLVSRLLEEAAAAGASQVILVTAAPVAEGPHRLRPLRSDYRGTMGEHLAASERVAVDEAVRYLGHRFQAIYQVRPTHNPCTPLDTQGADDAQSDRVMTPEELMQRGYEDTFRQFIGPVVGASPDRE